jgi:hypothetical protein
MNKPTYDKLLYAASILGAARQEYLDRAQEASDICLDATARSWEEGAARLAEVIKWLDGGAL